MKKLLNKILVKVVLFLLVLAGMAYGSTNFYIIKVVNNDASIACKNEQVVVYLSKTNDTINVNYGTKNGELKSLNCNEYKELTWKR